MCRTPATHRTRPIHRTHPIHRTRLVEWLPKVRVVPVDLAVFPLDAVKRAAYRFTDRFAVNIQVDGGTASCTLTFDAQQQDEMVDRTVSEFQRELLDQDLRARIRAETKESRNLILAYAFSRSGLISDDTIPRD